MSDELLNPYRVNPDGNRCEVRDELDRVVLVCGDVKSAESYVVLLNEAFRRGDKAGYRRAKKA